MSNTIGNIYRFTVWGQSHAPAIGVTIEGIPAGTRIDLKKLQAFLDRRKPGTSRYSTPRKEADLPEFVAGVTGAFRLPAEEDTAVAVACGAPVTAIIRNSNTRSKDYENLRYVPRPGHADYTAMVRYGEARDFAGGGQFSGRLTAPICIAGGIALQILETKGIHITARPVMIGGETEEEKMLAAIDAARAEGDSVGGIVECRIEGVPAGVGEPMFDSVESRLAQALFGIPAVKGVEFGSGFAAAGMRGSEHNDPFVLSAETECFNTQGVALGCNSDYMTGNISNEPAPSGTGDNHRGREALHNTKTAGNSDNGILQQIRTSTNHHGGILGGMTSGMPIVFRAAFKPTPSISREQDSVDIRTGEAVKLTVQGRHDPCIVLRAVPVVEAAAAAAIYDLMREWQSAE